MESWRKEFYGSDYGSQYLSHGRHKISEGGARNGETNFPWRYKPIGNLPEYLKEKQSLSLTKTSTTANRPVSREREVAPNTTGTVGRRGSPLPLGETAGNFKPTGPNGLNESYAANRPTTPPAGKTAEEPQPNGGPAKRSPYIMSDDKVNQDYIDSKIQKAGGIPNDIGWVKNIARIDEVLASKSDREALVNDLITNDKWFADAVSILGEKNAKVTINKYLDDYLSVEPNGLTTEQAAKLKEESEKKAAAEKKPAPSPMKKKDKEVLLDKIAKDSGSASINMGSSIESAKKTTVFSKGLDYVKKLFGQAKSAISGVINDVIKKR